MSDFTDNEDRQLVQLAVTFTTHGKAILWDRIVARMGCSKHSRLALRQRLKTLKRTHGSDLCAFPAWFFSKQLVAAVDDSDGTTAAVVSTQKATSDATSKHQSRAQLMLQPLAVVSRRTCIDRHMDGELKHWRVPLHQTSATSGSDPAQLHDPGMDRDSSGHCYSSSSRTQRLHNNRDCAQSPTSSLELLASVAVDKCSSPCC